MKKITPILTLVLILLFAFVPVSLEAVDFPITATIPAATGVSITATQNQNINGTEQFGPTVTQFNFDPMALDTQFGIWRSTHFFAIDVGSTGGAGNPDVVVAFSNESNPANQATGLGSKATAAFSLVTGGPAPTDQTEVPLTAFGPVQLLKQLIGGQNIDETALAGGFLRMRVGVYDGGDATLNAAGGEPFTNADQPGTYTGTFTVTATVD